MISAAAGSGYSMVLKRDGSVWSMGRNSKGQLGDGLREMKPEFSFAETIPGAKAIVAGRYHSAVLTRDGHVWTTGVGECVCACICS